MAYCITEDCIGCSACEHECPNQAISEGETIYIINPDRCTETSYGVTGVSTVI